MVLQGLCCCGLCFDLCSQGGLHGKPGVKKCPLVIHLSLMSDCHLPTCPGSERNLGKLGLGAQRDPFFSRAAGRSELCQLFVLLLLTLGSLLACQQAGSPGAIPLVPKVTTLFHGRVFPTLQVVICRVNNPRVTKEGPPLTTWADSAVLFL